MILPRSRRRAGRRSAAVLALGLVAACGGGGSGSLGAGGEGDGGGPSAPIDGDPALAGHVLRRLTYGETRASLDAVVRDGAAAFVEQQLDPDSIDQDEALLAILDAMGNEPADWWTTSHLRLVEYVTARALYSSRQLQERLALFWDYHFNTGFIGVSDVYDSIEATISIEWHEHETFRRLALGRFEDLLLASATSPTMLVYLNSVQNVVGQPNENYARELVELHSMGVDNGYVQRDVEEIARCFTGWSVCAVAPGSEDDPHAPCLSSDPRVLAFHFDPKKHDSGAKVIFEGQPHELVLPAREGEDGVLDGLELVRHLAGLPQTATFVSRKLAAHFVADDPPQALVDACVATWLQTDGDIREVLRTMLLSSAFLEEQGLRWNKVRTPLESLCGTLRALEAEVHYPEGFRTLFVHLSGALNHVPFFWETPDGYPEGGLQQLGTSKLLSRVAFAREVLAGEADGIEVDLVALLAREGVPLDDPEAILEHFFGLLFQGFVSDEDRERALAFLTTDAKGQPAQLDPAAADWEGRLQLFVAYVSALPQALLQ